MADVKDLSAYKGVWVFAEQREGKIMPVVIELLGEGRKLADAFRKAAVITLLAIGIVLSGTYILVILEPGVPFLDALFEMSSAFGTAGLSTGISAGLCDAAKILTILIMFIGRLGPLTIASLWYFTKGERVSYPEGNIAIG